MKVYGLKALFKEQKGNIREIRPVWALEEAGAKYELVLLDPKKREHKSPEYMKLNPFGKVPLIQDGDLTLFESAAICTYIGDKYGRYIPAPRSKERAIYDQWVLAALATIEPHTGRVLVCDFFLEQNEKTAAMREFAVGILGGFLKVVDEHLAKNKWMLGDDFTMADIAMTGSLHFVAHTELLKPHTNIMRFLESCFARPAYQRARELNAPLA